MTCADFREQFSARADDALTAAERAALDAHLATCPECRREWRRFAATVGLLRRVEPARAPAGFVDRVREAARPVPWYRRLARGLLVPWSVKLPLEAAAIVMVAGLAVLLFQRSSEMQEMAQAPGPRAYQAPAETRAETLSAKTAAEASKDTTRKVRSGPALTDERRVADAKPDAGRSEAQAPRVAQQQADEPLLAKRQQVPATAAAPVASPPNVASSAESYSETRAKRQDRLAQENERDAVAGVIQGARERKGEAPESAVQNLAAAPPPAAVELRLAVIDRAAAEREIGAVVERLGGAMVAPAPGTLEIMVPNRAFAALTGDLTRIGTLRIVRQPPELPDSVRISLRLTD